MTKESDVAKATLWYLLCDFILRGISFLTMPIYTRILSVAEIGDYSILLTWISFLSVTVTLNLTTAVIIGKFDFKTEFEYEKFLSSITLLGILSAGVFYLVVILFQPFFLSMFGLPKYALHTMCIYCMFGQAHNILLANYRAKVEYKKSVIFSLTTILAITIISLICTILFSDSLKGRIIGTYGTYIIIDAFLIIFIVRAGKAFEWKYCKYALAIAIPLIIHNLSGNIMASADKIMIKTICSSEDLGIYGVAYTCGMFVNVLRNSMNTSWYPWVFDKIGGNKESVIKKASYYYLIVFAGICMFAILIAPELLLILGGKEYLRAKNVVPPVVTAYMFAMIFSLYGGVEQFFKQQKYFAIFASACAVMNVVLNFIFIPKYGYIAAAYTTMLCSALEAFLHFLHVKHMNKHNIFDTKFNVVIMIFMTLFCISSIFFYRHDSFRYILTIVVFGVLIMLAIIQRRKLKQLIALVFRK